MKFMLTFDWSPDEKTRAEGMSDSKGQVVSYPKE